MKQKIAKCKTEAGRTRGRTKNKEGEQGQGTRTEIKEGGQGKRKEEVRREVQD